MAGYFGSGGWEAVYPSIASAANSLQVRILHALFTTNSCLRNNPPDDGRRQDVSLGCTGCLAACLERRAYGLDVGMTYQDRHRRPYT